MASIRANGTVWDKWNPGGSGSNFQLGQILSPLEPHKNEILVVSGVNGYDHRFSMRRASGHDGFRNALADISQGTTLDRHLESIIYKNIPPGGPSSMQIWASRGNQIFGNAIFSRRNGQLTSMLLSPIQAFNKAFPSYFNPGNNGSGNPQQQADEVKHRYEKRLSYLDSVNRDLASMKKYLSGEELTKINTDFDVIRDIEKRVQQQFDEIKRTGAVPTNTCQKPKVENYNGNDILKAAELYYLVLAAAFACQRTRIGAIAFNSIYSMNVISNRVPGHLRKYTTSKTWHNLAHWNEGSGPESGKTRHSSLLRAGHG